MAFVLRRRLTHPSLELFSQFASPLTVRCGFWYTFPIEMDGFLKYLMTDNGAIAVLSAYFVPYALPAWGVVLYRLVTRKLTRAEELALGLFALGAFVELFQLMFEGGRYHPLGRLDFRNLHRYLGALASHR